MARALAFIVVGFFWCAVPVAVFHVLPHLTEGTKTMIEYLCLWTGLVTFTVAAGTFFKVGKITGKRSDGSFPPFLAFFWAPYIFFQLQLYIHVFFRRFWHASSPIATKIHDGIYLSGWPHSVAVLPTELQEKEFILVDMTCELPRMVGTPQYYYNFPCWDGTGPTPEEFNRGVEEVVKRKQETGKPLLVHCGFGRGRSMTFLLAVMVSLDLHKTWEEAYEHVYKKRDIIHMPRGLKPLLLQWAEKRAAEEKARSKEKR